MRIVVTGAFGNVGRTVVRQLLADGHEVHAADLASRPSRRWAARLRHQRLVVHWGDLTDPATAPALLAAGGGADAVVHLAAVIPPTAYRLPALARRVNVEASRLLLDAVERAPQRPRLVFASSMAAFGATNPHTRPGLVDATTPLRPAEMYGAHKAEVEAMLAASDAEWTVLRLGAVVSSEMLAGLDLEMVLLEAALPQDGPVHAVDVRDVALAFAAAVRADCAGRVLLIGGDASTRLTQVQMSGDMTAALGLRGILPAGLPGDPADDAAWFCVSWMDTDEAQRLLGFQRHDWARTLADTRATFGPRRYVAPAARPVARAVLARRSPYHRDARRHADPWGVIAAHWGEAALEGRVPADGTAER
ncbi:NAD(P)-dependent oxidoreductase [Nocardioides sp. zg-DK7169]|uniref:NAD-dependent epimerase/dehydratase family protein n=1 Tax=Nocardioides sp. zg-DK7169 TaxID=2736600 RepID=UPI00155458FE|nr:NAD(P)-dependent oxidoreductase [Nocardioides sp. zg-DK7169]NPC98384.1 NAD(P)-dependent oxidoreductase [Nocardioides sp. zg-DK7169]